jgi:hypothetical protein
MWAQRFQTDLLLIQTPADFEILNRYQQKLTAGEKNALSSFAPWQIVDESMLLSDQFTKAMHVQLDGQDYYFALDEQGNFKTYDDPFIEIIRECEIYNDQIEIITDNSVLFREIPFSLPATGFPPVYLAAQSKLERLYSKGISYFVKNENNNRYGWIRISAESAIKKRMADNNEINPGVSEVILISVSEKITHLNNLYKQLYDHLNTMYNKSNPAPYWQINREEKTLSLQLINARPAKVKKSIAYLVNDLENMNIGQEFVVSATDGHITLDFKTDR